MQLATDTQHIAPSAPMASAGVPHSLTEDAFLGGKLSILQPEKGYRAGIDAVFLAAAIPCQPGDTVFEAGIGTGVASLCLLARSPQTLNRSDSRIFIGRPLRGCALRAHD